MIKLPNLTNFMLFSNDERVLSVNDGARRYYFCNIKKTEEEIINKNAPKKVYSHVLLTGKFENYSREE